MRLSFIANRPEILIAVKYAWRVRRALKLLSCYRVCCSRCTNNEADVNEKRSVEKKQRSTQSRNYELTISAEKHSTVDWIELKSAANKLECVK